MAEKSEMTWFATGRVAETYSQEGRKRKTFWKVIIQLDDGFSCIYVRDPNLMKVVETIENGQLIRAGGVITCHANQSNAARPIFLNATQLAIVNQ